MGCSPHGIAGGYRSLSSDKHVAFISHLAILMHAHTAGMWFIVAFFQCTTGRREIIEVAKSNT